MTTPELADHINANRVGLHANSLRTMELFTLTLKSCPTRRAII